VSLVVAARGEEHRGPPPRGHTDPDFSEVPAEVEQVYDMLPAPAPQSIKQADPAPQTVRQGEQRNTRIGRGDAPVDEVWGAYVWRHVARSLPALL